MAASSAVSQTRLGRWLLAAALLAGVAAVIVPRLSREVTLSPDELRLISVNDLKWEADSGTIHSGRTDPYFELVLPWSARPASELTLTVMPIWGNVGIYQFYYLPSDPPSPYFSGEMRVDVDAAIYGGPYDLKVLFPEPADRIRVDPVAGAQFVLQSVTVRSWPGQHAGVRWSLWVATIGLLLAAGACVGRDHLAAAGRRLGALPRWTPWVALGVLALIRIWLTVNQPLKAVGGALHDDQLFIDQAASIVDGQWLGPYNHLTLIKGPGYPLWIAAMYQLGVPLVLSQHLLYVGAALLLARALAPGFGPWARFAIAAVVLFNPAAFHGDDSARVLRNHFGGSLSLLTFVAAAGWYLRGRLPTRGQLGWAALTGTAYVALWLTREETVWMAGVLALFGLATAWALRGAGWAGWRRFAGVALVPVAIGASAVTAVCAINHARYGFWGTVEFRSSEFRDAYGALARIQVGPWRQFVPVSREAREAAYPVSPAFARLQPYLEGSLGVGWASLAESTTGIPAAERQIHGAGWMWALRDGAAAAGEHLSLERAMGYYRRLADEVNAACDDGRLPAGPKRSGFVPPWRSEYTRQLPAEWARALAFVSTFRYVVPRPPPSSGWDESLAVYRRLARGTLSPRPEDPPLPPAFKRSEDFKNGVMKDITRIYRWTIPAVALLALAAWPWLLWRGVKGIAPLAPVAVATIALAGAAAITLVVTLVHVTSFEAITIGYQQAAYPLLLAFVSGAAAVLAGGGREPSP